MTLLWLILELFKAVQMNKGVLVLGLIELVVYLKALVWFSTLFIAGVL